MLLSPYKTDDLKLGDKFVDKALLGSKLVWPYPLLENSLLAWWSADNPDMMTFNGNKVMTWKDRIGGKILSQGVDARRPVYSSTAFGGNKPGVSFVAATQQFLEMATSPWPIDNPNPTADNYGNAETFMVLNVQCDANVADTNIHTIFAYGDNVNNQRKLQRRVVQGVNRAAVAYGNGFNVEDGYLINTTVDFSGKHSLIPFFSDVNTSMVVDGVALGLCTYALRTKAGRTRMGCSANDVPDEFATCTIRDMIIGDASKLTQEFWTGLWPWGVRRTL